MNTSSVQCEDAKAEELPCWQAGVRFLTYTNVTQLSRGLCGSCAVDCCPLCLNDGSGMIRRLKKKKRHLRPSSHWEIIKKAGGTSSHHINIAHPRGRSPTLSQHLVPTAHGHMEVDCPVCELTFPDSPTTTPTTALPSAQKAIGHDEEDNWTETTVSRWQSVWNLRS